MSTKIVFRGGPADGVEVETYHKLKSLPPTMLPPNVKLLPGGLYAKGNTSFTPVPYHWKELATKS